MSLRLTVGAIPVELQGGFCEWSLLWIRQAELSARFPML